MRRIARARFDAFAGYCRSPLVSQLAHELEWFESADGNVLATLIIDTDEEFSGIVFARDLRDRFRWVGQTSFFLTADAAVEALGPLVEEISSDLETRRVQGDERGGSVDFFAPTVPNERLHPNFRRLAEDSGQEAAKNLIQAMMRWYEDRDGNFIQQFQTDGFDARVWELYLWATLVSLDYAAEFPAPSPDLLAHGVGATFAIEATTVNPSVHKGRAIPTPTPKSEDEVADYLRNYLPIRFAGPLTAKLGKRYWERDSVVGLPFALAIQDFHADFSMTFSGAALPSYLYGIDLVGSVQVDDVEVPHEKVSSHTWRGKTVQSGFFDLPGAQNIAAVIFNASGTLSKFGRIGTKVGLGSANARIIHVGLRQVGDGESLIATPFSEEVSEGYPEEWIDGMEVYHNPTALHPLDPMWLPGAAHHRCIAGRFESLVPEGHLSASRTAVVNIVNGNNLDPHRVEPI
ncbi:hypothetical protein [Aeromicrobium ginsengisoli]|uniref:Glycosaminoglycan attachment protein n=1 Tax=Aeromicrobium ginsengisoli TaxID=363867 RepID=A0A5M4FA08_9ACTN|nr:hypothetical protein [Aeromicrobium ginsengisoli]KAA1395117.1 hypothetical protein ESP70_013140 [Aeromicrobium ginsengisoli]